MCFPASDGLSGMARIVDSSGAMSALVDRGRLRSATLTLSCVLLCACGVAGGTDAPAALGEPVATGKHDLWHENQEVFLPFPGGTEVTIGQGFHGNFSHRGYGGYAIDFPAALGAPIAAARAGRVIGVREDSERGCADESCANDANYVTVDHGDGTVARYFHLMHEGAEVEVGDYVCQGQVIAHVGSTGWSSGEHLHFQVENVLGESIPVLFPEFARAQRMDEGPPLEGRRVYGVPFAGTVTSENQERSCTPSDALSLCDDIFMHFGVRLLSQTGCTVGVAGEPVDIAGIAYGTPTRVVVARQQGAGPWRYSCVPVVREAGAPHGTFSTSIEWDEPASATEQAYLIVTHATDDPEVCETRGGWAKSAKVTVLRSDAAFP